MPIRPAVNLWPVRSLVDPTFYTGSRHLATLAVENLSSLPWVYDVELISAAFVAGSYRWPDVSIGAGEVEVLHIWFDMIDQVGEYPVSAVVSEVSSGTTIPQFWFENIILTPEPSFDFYLVHYEPWSVDMVGELPWDFEEGLHYLLSDEHYISEPTSLRLLIPGSYLRIQKWALCNKPGALNLAEGRLATCWRGPIHAGGHERICFRNQAPEGSANDENCYMVTIRDTFARLERIVDGALEGSPGYWQIGHNSNVLWYLERWSWWNVSGSLYVRYEYYNEALAEWVTVGPDVVDNAPLWGDSMINRCGIGLRYSGSYKWYDDTEIYGVSR